MRKNSQSISSLELKYFKTGRRISPHVVWGLGHQSPIAPYLDIYSYFYYSVQTVQGLVNNQMFQSKGNNGTLQYCKRLNYSEIFPDVKLGFFCFVFCKTSLTPCDRFRDSIFIFVLLFIPQFALHAPYKYTFREERSLHIFNINYFKAQLAICENFCYR